ncbi:DUF5320 domain-containing protein [Proteinivorax hydrogeniformans]|uniref:DUF5320 domain-containing protein n=1 Tax=Proteinivorax hydrogeniformans TaxID=1826727 RepID=A0AAU8HUP6_9FIRM
MPNMNGTGPMSKGPMTGKGLGICNNTGIGKRYFRAGFGRRRGAKRGFGHSLGFENQKEEDLKREKDLLKARLKVVDSKLESL